MAPVRVEGTNMWKLLEGEKVEGVTPGGPAAIKGPAIVRVFEYTDINKLLIQGPDVKIEVEGIVFEDVVQKVE